MSADKIIKFIADEKQNNLRIDKALFSALSDITRSNIQNYIEKSFVKVNDKVVKKSYKLKLGDNVEIIIPPPVDLQIEAENIPLEIMYEDNDLLIVNKTKDMVVHPAPGNYTGTLVNALMYHCKGSLSGINGEIRPGIVHRIDKDTSGLLIVAKNDNAHNFLAKQISEHSFKREYEAIVYGNLLENGRVDAPIGRSPKDRKKMAVTNKSSKNAITNYKVIEHLNGFTHIRLRLETGRTHQIRVHMAYIGHPVAGDPVYGPKKVITSLHGQCLHARVIGFIHPTTHEYMEFSSELPEYFKKFLQKVKEK